MVKEKKLLIILISFICILFSLTTFSNANDQVLESTKYLILEEKGYISRIIPETVVPELKQNFNIPAENIHIYQDNTLQEEVTDGYIGTGMVLTYEGSEEQFELSVIGDFNKDGLMNQIELNLLIKHVIGLQDSQLEGLNKTSADITGDTNIDQIDITTFIRYIVYHELYIPEIVRPEAPEIEVISGTLGENEWYNTNVVLRIKENESAVPIGKTIYKITGTKTVDETIITSEETITLEEGEYKVTAYSYSTEGAKSKVVSKTIKIDLTAPELVITLTGGTNTINVSVEANDNLSGIQGYIYYIGEKDENGEIIWQEGITSNETTYEFTNLKKETEYYIRVSAIDFAGNTTTKEDKYSTGKIPSLYDDETAAEEGTEPNITVEKSEDDWTNQDVIVKIELDEDVDPNDEYDLEYSLDGGETWEKYDPEVGITVPENGDIHVSLTDGDNRGEEAVITIDNIDKQPPTGDILTIPTQNTINVRVDATDELSGIEEYIYYIGKEENGEIKWEEGIHSPDSTHIFENLDPNTEYIVKVEVVDKAGNVTEITETVITMENGATGQFVSITQNTTKWTNGDVIATVRSHTTEYTTEYSLDGNTWEPFDAIKEVTFTQNGTIFARVLDNSEILEIVSLTISNIDKEAPRATIETLDITSRSFKASLNAKDDISGIAKLTWYYKPATSETYTEEFANYVVVGSTAQGKTELVKEYEYKDLPAGTYWVCAEIIDAAGNSIVTDTIYVETLEVTPGDEGVEVTKDNNNWTNEEVTVHINKKDDRYEILTSTNGEDWTNNTEYTFEENGSVFIKLTDGINEGEVYEYKVTNIDKENPQAQINQKEVTSKSFTVNADITDNASGLGQIKWYYKNEADAEYTEVVQDYQVIKGPDAGELNTSKELKVDNLVKGTYKVYAVVVDVAGNEITTNEITIVLETITAGEDALTFTPNTQNWTNQPVTVTLTNSDERYEIETSTNGTEWNRTNTATLTENGTVYGRLTDGVNSGEISTIDINNIDVTPIEGSLESKDVTSKSLTVQANITDNASGLAEIEWYFKKDTDTEYTKTIENYQTIGGAESGELSTSKDITYDNLTSGKYQIYAIVTDVAGNKTTLDQIEVTLTVITAGEAGIEFISSNENWTNQNITMTVNSTDERYTVLTSTDNASWSPATEIEFSANGTIYARLTDGINQGTVTSREVTNIDKEPLVANVTNADVASRNFTQKIDITDNLSGLGKVEIYYKEPTDENYEVFETVYQAINGSVSGETATSKNITVDGLTTGTYKTYAVITDVAGNTTQTPETEVTLLTITPGTTALTLTPNTKNWTNQPVTVTVTNNDERYTIETSTNGTSWDASNTATLTSNGTVYARLTDGINSGETASLTITNIDTTLATGSVKATATTSKSMTIEATAQDLESGVAQITWYYQKDGEAAQNKTVNYKTINGSEKGDTNKVESQTFDNLTNGTYKVWAVITDVAGNQTTTTQITVNLDKITSGVTALTLTPDIRYWTNGNVTVNVTSTDSKYSIQTSTNGTTWNNSSTVTLTSNGTVYARLYDGVNGGEAATLTISNIDKNLPTTGTIASTPGGTSISLSLTSADTDSGIAQVTWYYKVSSASTYTSVTDKFVDINGTTAGSKNRTLTKTLSGLTAGNTYNVYAEVYDVAGNKTTTGTINAITNTAPTMGTVTFNSKTTNSITVRATATDRDGDNLTYTLYVSTSLNGSYTPNGTATGASGSAVTLTATGLSQYTTYYYYVHVTDTIATAQSSKGQNVRTYCPGTGLTCTTEACSGTQITTCTTCDGNGEVSERCTDGYVDTCSRCDGSGETSSRCDGGSSERCSTCRGSGEIPCPGTPKRVSQQTGHNCPECGHAELTIDQYRCSECGTGGYARYCSYCGFQDDTNNHDNYNIECPDCNGEGEIVTECEHGYTSSHTVYEECSRCNGSGEIDHECEHGYTSSHTYYDECSRCNGIGTITTTPCIHGYSSAHRHCEHFETTTAVTHQYCSHGETSQHD